MNNVPYAYESAEHFIHTQADVEAAIEHRAQRVTFQNDSLVKHLSRMSRVKYLTINDTTLRKLPPLPPALKVLNCSHNALKHLPTLPSTLKE